MSETSSTTSQAEPAAKKPDAPASSPSPAPASAGFQPRLVTVHAVNWANILDFTHLFRGFRLAINPAKILIALLAIALIYVAGRTFDAAWGRQVRRNDIELYATQRPDARVSARDQAEQIRQLELSRLLI